MDRTVVSQHAAEEEPAPRAPARSEDPRRSETGVEPALAESKGSWRRRWKRTRRKVGSLTAAAFGPLVLSRLSRTWKVSLHGEERLARAQATHRGHFMALWHGRMLLGLPHHGRRDWHVLVSPSADGDISQRLLERFRYKVIRGSSSRGGARALREMLTVLDAGAVLIITPDGPRGPRHSMNPGLAWMARATGYPIVPIGFGVDRAWRLNSWDRFTIPKPGARVAMVYGEPISVPRAATSAELDSATRAIHDSLVAAEREGFAHLASPVDW